MSFYAARNFAAAKTMNERFGNEGPEVQDPVGPFLNAVLTLHGRHLVAMAVAIARGHFRKPQFPAAFLVFGTPSRRARHSLPAAHEKEPHPGDPAVDGQRSRRWGCSRLRCERGRAAPRGKKRGRFRGSAKLPSGGITAERRAWWWPARSDSRRRRRPAGQARGWWPRGFSGPGVASPRAHRPS